MISTYSPSQKGNDLTHEFTMLCECEGACMCIPLQLMNMSEESPRIIYAQCHFGLFMNAGFIFPQSSGSVQSRGFLDHMSDRSILKQTLLHGALQSVPSRQAKFLINIVPVPVLQFATAISGFFTISMTCLFALFVRQYA